MIIYPDEPKWWEVPLRCLLGFHKFRPHPGTWRLKVCRCCGGEKEVR